MAQHKDLTGTDLHEPKDITTATTGQVYVADGVGSGAWTLAAIQAISIKVVNTMADFPAAVAGVRTLDDNVIYILGTSLSTSDRFVLGVNNAMTSMNIIGPLLTYTGSGVMFTGVNKNFTMYNMGVDCPNGTLWNLSRTSGVAIVVVRQVICYNCVKYGTVDDLTTWDVTDSSSLNGQDGLTVVGSNWSIFSMGKFAFAELTAANTGIDFGTAVLSTLELNDLVFREKTANTATGIKGAAANANVVANSIATVAGSEFSVTTPLSGITVDDFRWNFQGNGVVEDTQPDALLSLSANATATTTPVGVPTVVAGTWTDERASHFTNTTGGRSTYNAERPVTTPIDAALTADPATGTNKSIRAFIAINGTAIVASSKAVNIGSGDPKEIVLQWQAKLTATDFVEVFIENETDSVNVTVIDATLRVR